MVTLFFLNFGPLISANRLFWQYKVSKSDGVIELLNLDLLRALILVIH